MICYRSRRWSMKWTFISTVNCFNEVQIMRGFFTVKIIDACVYHGYCEYERSIDETISYR